MRLKIVNASGEPISLHRNSSVLSGGMRVFIADESKQYKEYKGPRWGLKDNVGGQETKLDPGSSNETSATILYNHIIETYHLNEQSAARINRDRIGTEYVFPQPGVFFVKAVLYDAQYSNPTESAPVRITIKEPQGPDLIICNKIKEDGAYAYFLQTGEALERAQSPSRTEIATRLKELEALYPTSGYAEPIRAALAKQHSGR